MSYEKVTIDSTTMEYENLIYEKGGDRILRLTLNRPEKLNALNTPLMNEIKAALEQAERDEDIRVIIIKGAGRAFSAGYDLTPPAKGEEPAKLPIELANKYHIKRNHDVWFTIWNLLKPVIAQVHGYCLAGASELAFMCDENATFKENHKLNRLASIIAETVIFNPVCLVRLQEMEEIPYE